MLIIWIISTTGLHARSTSMTSNSHRHLFSPSPSQLLGYSQLIHIFYCPVVSDIFPMSIFPMNMLLALALSCCTQFKHCQAEELTWQFPNQMLLLSESRKLCEDYYQFWWARGKVLSSLDDDTVSDIRIPKISQTSLPSIHETLPATLMRIVHCQATFTLESKQVLIFV